jgi:hypothetical protein
MCELTCFLVRVFPVRSLMYLRVKGQSIFTRKEKTTNEKGQSIFTRKEKTTNEVMMVGVMKTSKISIPDPDPQDP